jgi:potassium-dependent mechanosensitive channel
LTGKISSRAAMYLFLLFFLGRPSSAQIPLTLPAEEAKPAPVKTAQRVSISDIPERVQQSAAVVRAASRHAAPLGNIVEIERAYPDFSASVRALLSRSRKLLNTQRSTAVVQNLRGTWATVRRRLDGWQTVLKQRSNYLHNDVIALRQESETWTTTKEGAAQQELPPDLLEEIDQNLRLIQQTEQAVLTRRNEILKLQGGVAELGIELDQLDDELQTASDTERAMLFRLDAPPIWKAPEAKPVPTAPVEPETTPQTLEVVQLYLWSLLSVIALQAGVFAVVLVLLLLLRRRSVCWPSGGDSAIGKLRFVAGRPYSAALLITIVAGLSLDPRAPDLLVNLGWLLMLVPLLRIIPGIISPGMKAGVWLLAALYAANLFVKFFPGQAIPTRLMVVLFEAVAIGGLVWLDRSLRKTLSSSGWRRATIVAVRIAAGLLCIAVVAEIAGATGLSRYLLSAVLRSVYGAVAVYGMVLIVQGALEKAVHSRSGSALVLGQLTPGLQDNLSWGMSWLGLISFIALMLKAFRVAEPLLRTARTASKQTISLGAIDFTLGAAVTFVGVLLATAILSRVLRFLLSAGLYGRMAVQRGTGEAVSKLLHYTVLTGGFLLALGAAGIDLNRFTLLAGAVGVGVGLGLQTIVNNFVSGLILLFERPLHVGDKITVGDTSGEVKDIGIRASRIHTWEGADVIIPNGNLISGNFTNWTLSDDRRRGELKVGAAYGTHPGRVLRILRELASAQPLIIKEPPPSALFTGFGESSLDFCVRYWTHLENYVDANSQLHEAVCERLASEGIEIPFPQRDLNVKSVDPAVIAPGLDGSAAAGAEAKS